MDLLHDFPVDAVTHFDHPFPVHESYGFGYCGSDACEQTPVIVVERRLRPHEDHRAPGGAAPADWSHHHVVANRRTGVTDEFEDVLQIPGALPRDSEQQLRFRGAWFSHRDAAGRCVKEGARLAERMRQCLARLTDGAQVLGKRVEELEELEFPGGRQHVLAPGSVNASCAVAGPTSYCVSRRCADGQAEVCACPVRRKVLRLCSTDVGLTAGTKLGPYEIVSPLG